ncbi:MAG: hypothetical protein ACYDAK_12805, partial [Candidatus Limnocylindrales bacterium]
LPKPPKNRQAIRSPDTPGLWGVALRYYSCIRQKRGSFKLMHALNPRVLQKLSAVSLAVMHAGINTGHKALASFWWQSCVLRPIPFTGFARRKNPRRGF